MSTNDNIPTYNVNGWLLWCTSPLRLEAALQARDELQSRGRTAKLSGQFTDTIEGDTFAYVRVKA